jgi:hypothetical protein
MGKNKKSPKAIQPSIEHSRSLKNKPGHNDPIGRITEWQEHRYNPGHYTGGNVHPLIRGRRPNRYGYVLIIGGVMTTTLTVLALRAGSMPVYQAFVMAPFLSLILMAGFKLIRREDTSHLKTRRGKKDRKR